MKLYWRIKNNGKWTWRSAKTRTEYLVSEVRGMKHSVKIVVVEDYEEE